ncbi:MAG: serine/threonine protein kinase, partial [Myxococcales bacterium]|nr:serine/threonine protein kinase [Myxococcales bacterium]
HLDLKPANVVLRGGHNAVLVDFGLAGRTIRPGCGSAAYSPPEVWGYGPEASTASATAADVYAFACLAFETLTGQLLFDADNEVNMISQHMAHDGLPPRLRLLAQNPRLGPLAELMFTALRRDPQARMPIGDLDREIARVGRHLEGLSWPIAFG